MRNKYLLYSGLIVAVGLVLSHSPLVNAATGTLEEAWNAITKLQTDPKNVQFTSGLPGPKTIEFMNNVLISSNNDSPDAEMSTRWFEVSGGYNRITFDVQKTGGRANASIRAVFLDFTNDPANPNTKAWAEQAKLECQETKCTLTTLPLLAKFYRLRVNANSGIRISAYGYVSTDGLPGPKGPQGLTGPKGDKGDPSTGTQLHLYDGSGQDLGILTDQWQVFSPSLNRFIDFDTNNSLENFEFYINNRRSIYYSSENCSGLGFIGGDRIGKNNYPDVISSNLDVKLAKYYRTLPILHKNKTRKSVLQPSGECNRIDDIVKEAFEVEEIQLPFKFPITWPLIAR